jgi:hypothetical protein
VGRSRCWSRPHPAGAQRSNSHKGPRSCRYTQRPGPPVLPNWVIRWQEPALQPLAIVRPMHILRRGGGDDELRKPAGRGTHNRRRWR